MRVSFNFALPLAALLLILPLVPQAALAAATNCPIEPTRTSIASGDDYAGSNCVLYTPGDVDSFVFSANQGDTYQVIVAYQGGYNGTCMALYDPNGSKIFPNPTNPNNCTGNGDLVARQTLTATGKYTINLTQQGNGSGGDYALSLERISPFPPDAQQVTLAHAVNATFAPANEQITYTFNGFTTGTYLVSLNYTGGYNGTCISLYYPGSANPQPPPDQGCTGNGVFQFTFTPPQNGTYMVLLTGQGDGSGGNYSFEVSCFLGTCNSTKEPTKTTLTSSPNPSTDGQAVTFTAVVSSSGGAPPNGELVSFMNGTKVLGTGQLSGGKATFSTSKLAAGATTSVTAVYPGDSNFLTSTSNVVKQVVQALCTLTDSLSYNASSGTLTMKFTVGNTEGTTATWNAWLTYQNTMVPLFSISQPITNPPAAIPKTYTGLSKEGNVGVLSTLTVTTKGVVCSSWVHVNTGTP